MPANSKTSATGKKQREKKQASRNRNQQDLDPREELVHPNADEYGLLCQFANYIQQMSPWNFMEETDVFGFQDPESGALGFVSVMGQLGEFQAISVYRGVEGLYGWRNFVELLRSDADSNEAHDMIYEIPQLQLSFGPSTMLAKRDRDIIKASGFKFTKNQLPQFRSYRPGYLPWFLTLEEASHLIYALTQTITVASSFFSDSNVLPVIKDSGDRDYLIRVPRLEDSIPYWDDSIVTIDPPPPPQLPPFSVDDISLRKLKKFPGSGALEVDLFILPAKVGKSNERPRLIYALLAVDAGSDFIMKIELMEAIDGVDLMYANVAETLASNWMQHEVVPREIRVRSARLLNVLAPLTNELGITLSPAKKLPAVNRARTSMIAYLEGEHS